MKAVFLDYETLGAEQLDTTRLFALLPDIELFARTARKQTPERIRNAEVVLVNKVRLLERELETASRLRYIGVAATGTDNVDLDYAAGNNIAVTNIPDYCTQSVVEHVFGVLLSLSHNLHQYRQDTADGLWQRATSFSLLHRPIRQLSSLTLGIVGYGTLGRAVAAMAKQFGMQVLIAARSGSGECDGRSDIKTLLRESDVISLHCPLTDETSGLIAEKELALMKPNAFLINTARGALVDSAALVSALASGTIGGAAIDVLAEEPPVSGDPLLDYRGADLILTPHIAWAAESARQKAIDEMAKNLEAFLDGKMRNRIGASVADASR